MIAIDIWIPLRHELIPAAELEEMGSRLEQKSNLVRKRIEEHTFEDEQGEEYEPSTFGGYADYMRRKKIKLQNLDHELRANSSKPQIFKRVVCHVNGYTQPSLSDLHKLVVERGGGFVQYLDGKTMVTHIIASSITPKKKEEFRRYRIVKPGWIVDSVKAGKLLPWDKYRVVDEGVGQKILAFDNGQMVSQANRKATSYREQSDTSWYASGFKGKEAADDQSTFLSSTIDKVAPDDASTDQNDSGDVHEGKTTPTDVAPDDNSSDENIPAGYAHLEDVTMAYTSEASRVDGAGTTTLTDDATAQDGAVDGTIPEEAYDNAALDEDAIDGSITSSIERAMASADPGHAARVPLKSASAVRDDSKLTGAESQSTEPHAAQISDNVLERSVRERAEPQRPLLMLNLTQTNGPERYNLLTTKPDAVVPPTISEQQPADEPADDHRSGSDEEQNEKPASELRPRQGSQEPDYTMAVIANSDIVKAVPPEKLASMTAEQHNALLLSDPKIRKSTVVHPDFLEQYYRESRLHHLSTWKADLKSQLQALAAEKSSQKTKMKKLPGQRRYIMHVDFDSFFAAVSLKKYPQFKDKPSVVAHGGGSGSEIASCNYKAREYGIKNGMWMRRAQELCSDLKILPYDFPAYEQASRKFYDAILATGGIVQSVSIDEALIDISALCFADAGTDGIKRNEGAVDREQQKADDIGNALRSEVLRETDCAVSVGIGANILQAKVALRKAKPAGQFQLKPEEVLDFMGMLEVQALPGIAWSIGGKLEDIGIKLVKDVRECTKEKLVNTLGPKTGEKIWEYARGIDKVEVGDQVIRKSVSAEVNWGVRFENQEQVDEFMVGLSGELHKRLLKERVKGKQLTMKVMRRAADAPLDPPKHLGHGKCDTYNKSLQLGLSTNDAVLITKEATAMIRSFNISPGELRGIGIQMQKLEPIKPVDQSSQKRLQFRTGTIEDQVRSESSERAATKNILKQHEPSIAIKPISETDKQRLNIQGTQFVLPTQVDPKVLAELPADIRERLTRSASSSKAMASEQELLSMPATESQLDPEALEALPPDLREEVLAAYGTPRRKRQVLLPHSPQKPLPLKQIGRRKRPMVTTFRRGDRSSLTQTNFVARLNDTNHDSDTSADFELDVEQVDEEYLSALPDDIKKEVLAQQRQARLQRTGGINTSLHSRGKKKSIPSGPLDRVVRITNALPRPTFTSKKLSTLSELRGAIDSWIEEFDADGPFEEDVAALVTYLKQVVLEEKNLEKAVAVVKWLSWVVEEGNKSNAWENTVTMVQAGVQQAIRERGIGAVSF